MIFPAVREFPASPADWAALRAGQEERVQAMEQVLAELEATNRREEPRAGVVMTATRQLSPEELRVMRGMGHSRNEWLASDGDEDEERIRKALGHSQEDWDRLDQQDDEEADGHNLKILEALERSPL